MLLNICQQMDLFGLLITQNIIMLSIVEKNRIHLVACVLDYKFKIEFLFKEVCIASDHAGYKLKENIKDFLINKYVSIIDLGPFENKSVDYPDYAKKLAKRINLKVTLVF